MAAPSFDTNGAGATDAGGAWSYAPSFAGAVGKVVILQILQDGTTNGAVTLTGAANVEDLAGTANAWTQIPGGNADGSFPVGSAAAARQFLYIGRRTNALTAPSASGGNSTSEDLYMIMVQFADVSAGTTLATVIENGTAGTANNGAGTGTSMSDTAVTTLGTDRLACNWIAVNDDVLGASYVFSGESGGTWTDRPLYNESTGTDGALALSEATMASAGTIDGATATITSAAWGVVGFALIGTTVATQESWVHMAPHIPT